ncbi:hypothetical protein L798_02948 [Zootermopsis nevadensis]|uniref:Uncharacterized protein n=1 Tax=Zootermopsis nevadensis TaxID=136037 RepID=A0A067QU28_ZOONE|nr:hypothetical protein L798_02948 [Zootermopsis nevadensis]
MMATYTWSAYVKTDTASPKLFCAGNSGYTPLRGCPPTSSVDVGPAPGSQQGNGIGHEQEPCHLQHFDAHGALRLCPDDSQHSAERAVPMEHIYLQTTAVGQVVL